MKNIFKSFIKKILRKTNWRIQKIHKNKSYVNNKPNLELVKAMVDCNGIIHMGAHRGQEAPVYDWFNKKTIWIEANPNLIDYLQDNVSQFINQEIIQALISNQDKIITKFNISDNDGASSSIFKFDKAESHAKIKMTNSIELESIKLDTLLIKNKIDVNKYNFWVMDLQGAELLALQGATDSLKNCKYIYCEISKENIYINGAEWNELKKFLNNYGFIPSWEPETKHTDVLFYKKNI
jgi:FkbM family methyltransferase